MKPKVEAFIFDVFGTLVDWRYSIARSAEETFSNKGIDIDATAFADYWRGQYDPAMARIRTGNRGYVALDVLHYENLVATLAHFDLAGHFSEPELWQFSSAWERLDPWPEVVDGLTHLKQRAIIAPCSNGSIALMTRLAKYGGLPWDCILGADIAGNYKPQPEVYQACCSALRLSPDQVMMVACHNKDLIAARAAGLQTGFIPRPTEHGPDQSIDLGPEADWEAVVDRISDLSRWAE